MKTITRIEYHCPVCKTALGYEGLCWRCKAEQERKRVLEWTDFWNLLRYRNAITPAIQRAALAAGVFEPAELYYHAPKDVRDGLMNALMNTDNCNAEDELMKCLAMQGDDKVLNAFYEMEKNLRFVLHRCVRIPVLTVVGKWQTCWFWMAEMNGWAF